MTRTQWIALACAAGAVLLEASSARAQTAPAGWDRLSVTVRQSVFVPAGGGEAWSLFSREFTPGPSSLYVGVAGGELRWRVRGNLALIGGAESGGRTISTEARNAPAGTANPIRQYTTLGLRSMQYAGVTWMPLALPWRGAAPVRLGVTAGGGRASYRLHQWGEFVDRARQLTFADDLVSGGRGTFGYLALQAELPLWRGVALAGDVRRQFGSAPMSVDFAGFDRLDLGGTRAGIGLTITPARLRR
ncbi:MAG: hypothetical protein K2R93_17930 [Gemmatimonadaceae bacterium]|nr:hypothetical protein [Gemmatimonadaceae bacterium]